MSIIMPKKYSDVEKQEILTAYQHGQTLANIGGKFGVAPSTIYRWVKDKKECITEENMLLLGSGEINHSGSGENRQFWSNENHQSGVASPQVVLFTRPAAGQRVSQ